MRNLWHSIAPFATDTSGACAVFSRSNAFVVAQDSNGTVSTLRRVIDLTGGAADYTTVDLPEVSYALGREDDFIEQMAAQFEVNNEDRGYEGQAPCDFVVLVNGPVSSLLGTDLVTRARHLQDKIDLPMLAIDTTGNEYYDKGISKAYRAIYENIVRPQGEPPQQHEGVVNILGVNLLDHPGSPFYRQMMEGIMAADEALASDWGYTDSYDRWVLAPLASRNIVASASGLEVARMMRDELGIPYVPVDETGWFDKLVEGQSFRGAPRVLVIGEQVTSNLLRRLMLAMGAASVDLATFFTLDRELRQPQDRKLKGESDLAQVMGAGYDLIVGDRVFDKPRLRTAGCKFIPLMHPPAGFGRRDGSTISRTWFEHIARQA